jgi:hypothetical protein
MVVAGLCGDCGVGVGADGSYSSFFYIEYQGRNRLKQRCIDYPKQDADLFLVLLNFETRR